MQGTLGLDRKPSAGFLHFGGSWFSRRRYTPFDRGSLGAPQDSETLVACLRSISASASMVVHVEMGE